MKKIILFTLLCTSLFADSKVYMGLGYSLYNENYTASASDLPDTSDNALRLKFGYGIREAYAIEFALEYIDHATYTETPSIGKAKYGFDVSLIKAFDLGIYINPYIKAGFGAGMLDNFDEPDYPSLSYGSFNLGTGFFIPINEYSDFEIAYEYKNLSYEPQDQLDSTIQNASHANSLYVGCNIRF